MVRFEVKGDGVKKREVVIVSLFDGLSGGRVSFDRVEHIEVLRYYSSEVDPYAIKVADKNYPQDKVYRLGDVTKIDGVKLLAEIRAEFGDVAIILIGGSPCQGFSMAGKLKGSSTACGIDVVSLEQYLDLKAQNFEFDGQSYLLWEFVRIQKEIVPDYFMLENVRVTKKWLPMFNEAMGIKPLRINSLLVSAQNRDRYYWHNLGHIEQPDDDRKLLVIRDILDYSVSDSFPKHRVEKFEETMKDEAVQSKNGIVQLNQPSFSQQRVYGIEGKSPTIAAGNLGGGKEPCKIKMERPIRVGEVNKGSQGDRIYSIEAKGITLSAQSGGTAGNGNMLIERPCEPKVLIDKICNVNPSGNGMNGNVYGVDAKSPTVTTNKGEGNKISGDEGATYRKLIPLECERLQTLPDNYTEGVSNSQRYKMIGNGWTVDVTAHIFRHIPLED